MNTTHKGDLPEVTIDELAVMTKKGFEGVKKEFANVRSEMKAEFADVRGEMRDGFNGVRQSIALVLENMATKADVAAAAVRSDDIERMVYKDHSPRLRRVEHKLNII